MIPKKKRLRSLFALIGLFSIPAAALPAGQTKLQKAYKSGPIRLERGRDFGKNTDWNSLFYYLYCDLTAAPDGSLFIASSRQHKIFKFDPDGNLIKSFGRKGQGPGDFRNPGDLSILDEKLLVVGEYGLSLRISLFDLEGNFVKLLKTGRPPSRPTALRSGKIAYITYNYTDEGEADSKKIESVAIRDGNSGQENIVAKYTFNLAMLRIGQGMLSFADAPSGALFIASSKAGNLIVGNSLHPHFEVYSPEGAKIAAIRMNIKPIPVTKQLISRYKKYHLDEMSRDSRASQDQIQYQQNILKKASWEHLFSETLPLYRNFLVDGEGNLIVFIRSECLEDCPIIMQIYSPEGEFICATELVEGPFDLNVDPRINNMLFTDQGLIAMVEVKDAPEFELRVIKVNYE